MNAVEDRQRALFDKAADQPVTRIRHAQPGVRAHAPAHAFYLAIVAVARRSTGTFGLAGCLHMPGLFSTRWSS
jgi:hypothetical protein